MKKQDCLGLYLCDTNKRENVEHAFAFAIQIDNYWIKSMTSCDIRGHWFTIVLLWLKNNPF